MHDEDPANGVLASVGLTGTKYISQRCTDCHQRNGSAPVVADGESLDRWVFKIGDASGNPIRTGVLQPNGAGETDVSIASWTELENGLRKPNYQFSGRLRHIFRANCSTPGRPRTAGSDSRIGYRSPRRSGRCNNDGISGRTTRYRRATGQTRIGRFGWKAAQPTVKQQTAAALNTDIGVRTSVMPDPAAALHKPIAVKAAHSCRIRIWISWCCI